MCRAALRRPKPVLAAAAPLCALFAALTPGLWDRLASGDFTATGTDSERAAAVAARYGADRPELLLVLRPVEGRPSDPAVAAAGRRLTAALAAERGVVRVRSDWDGRTPGLRSAAVLAGR